MAKRGPYLKGISAEERLRLKNERRRAARAADPGYRARANAYQKAHEERTGDRVRLSKREWIRSNPQQKRVNRQRRRAREYAAPGHHTAAQLAMLWEWQGGRCAYCDAAAETLDHCTPLVRGGSNWPWNLQYLCGSHNSSKLDRTDSEYRALIGLPPATPIALAVWRAALLAPLFNPAAGRPRRSSPRVTLDAHIC